VSILKLPKQQETMLKEFFSEDEILITVGGLTAKSFEAPRAFQGLGASKAMPAVTPRPERA
jgi:hypothetical protein